jgi:hypothetical protein
VVPSLSAPLVDGINAWDHSGGRPRSRPRWDLVQTETDWWGELAYGSELSLTYAELTARRLLEHLQTYGVDLTQVVLQTDSGSEFDGQAMHQTTHGFTHTVEQRFGAHHRRICGNANANADVESFHAHEETEFFDLESFTSPRDFWEKITTYQHYWNLGRPNSYKADRTPLHILQQANPRLPPEILLLAPANLDTLAPSQLGHDLPVLPARQSGNPSLGGGTFAATDSPRRNAQPPAGLRSDALG